jgi:hypothetical protein
MSLNNYDPNPLTRCSDCGEALYRNDEGELVDDAGATCCDRKYPDCDACRAIGDGWHGHRVASEGSRRAVPAPYRPWPRSPYHL